jgi:ATP-dependent DNA ligase
MDLTKLKLTHSQIIQAVKPSQPPSVFRPYYMGCGSQIHVSSLWDYEKTGDYIAEPKFDGIWGAVITTDSIQRHLSKTGLDKGIALPKLDPGTIVVGEFGYGSQTANERKIKIGHDFMDVIDILMLDGKCLKDLDANDRRVILEGWHSKLTQNLKEYFLLAPRYTSNFAMHCNDQPEGLVLKKIKNRPKLTYQEGVKTEYFVKVKKVWTVDVIITGFDLSESTTMKGLASNFRFSVWRDGKLFELGAVGNLDLEMRKDVIKNWSKYEGRVLEVECYKIFDSGSLRHPAMLRLRDDKSPSECTFDEVIKLRHVV